MGAQATFHIHSSQPADGGLRRTGAAAWAAEYVAGEQMSMAQR